MKLNIKIRGLLIYSFFLLSINLFAQICDIIPPRGFGGEYEKGVVIDSWINSGAYPINSNNLYIDLWIDATKSNFNIQPGENPMGQNIQNLIDSYNDYEGQVLIYFPPGQYIIESTLSIKRKIILKGAGGDKNDPNKTEFWLQVFSGYSIAFNDNAYYSGLEDIYLAGNPFYYINSNENFFSEKEENNKDLYNNTINISRLASHCWIRGVESFMTRRFHVSIAGHNITVSGCYFYCSWSYDEGGRGYGVVLGGNLNYDPGAYYCRIEDNIFHDLRHSMVFQYDPQQNVVAYNYSRDPRDENGYNDNVSDLLFHGNHGDDQTTHIGPHWNLCEGNICTYLRFDEYHKQNGPYNSIFRSKSFDTHIDHINGVTNQYKQNFVGSDTDPDQITIDAIEDYGYSRFWIGDENGNNDWEDIPEDSCSYYQSTKPLFWEKQVTWLPWPFLANGLIPAKYRYDRNHDWYPTDPPTSEVVFAGWETYNNMCGPPYLAFSNETFNNISNEFLAMNEIETEGNVIINSNNNIVYKAEERIILNPGFKVTSTNNYFYAKAGNTCNAKTFDFPQKIKENPIELLDLQNHKLKNHSYNSSNSNYDLQNDFNNKYSNKSIVISPNPNNGIFSLSLPVNISTPIKITIINAFGKSIFCREFSNNVIKIDISNNPNGIYFVKFLYNNEIITKKIIYCL